MKYLILSLTIYFVGACSSAPEKGSWNGAQRQEAEEDYQIQQQEQFRNQAPGRTF